MLKSKSIFLLDMDGVIYHGNQLLPGASAFIHKLKESGKSFVFITNASDKTRDQLSQKLNKMGIFTDSKDFFTSALATAEFVSKQKPLGSAFVIGDDGLIEALKNKNYRIIQEGSQVPDYVIVGETAKNDVYNHSNIKIAINYVLKGAFLIGTNKDVLDNSEDGYNPGCGALLAPIQTATGVHAYFLGKPNPIMMNLALESLKRDGQVVTKENSVIIGDRMDTDIIGGLESGLSTILLFSGISQPADLKKYSYSPDMTFNNLQEIIKEI